MTNRNIAVVFMFGMADLAMTASAEAQMLNDIAEAAPNENIGPMPMSCRMIRPR
ncbi:MAG: hypothetical protein HRU31_11860 [Rhodobacteraceae bacterium]|nr:hypothetical protein [Paracoccaceae bacterium]